MCSRGSCPGCGMDICPRLGMCFDCKQEYKKAMKEQRERIRKIRDSTETTGENE